MSKIRCRFCHEAGHNVKGCPKMKQMAASAAQKSAEERSYTEKYALAKSESYKNVSRRCSYCSDSTHTRKTCKVFARHLATRNSLEIRWRSGVAKIIAESPIKIGSFVEWVTWDNKKTQAILTGVNYKELNDTIATNQLMGGSDVGKDWFLYTILNTESTSWWGPKVGEISAGSIPFKNNDEFMFAEKNDPFYIHESYNRYYSSSVVNILSEGVGSIQLSEEWINKVDVSTIMKTHKRINIENVDEKLSNLDKTLTSLGF